jgi:hypothetical protein
MSLKSDDEFRAQLLSFLNAHLRTLMTPDGEWAVKGFIDVFKNIYAISIDTKVISKILELMLLPIIQQFARAHSLEMILSQEQNHYPDISFIFPDGEKIALDMKSAYRINSDSVSGFTLGAFTGYFRFRNSAKNVTFPYRDYSKHYVLGIIYTRQAEKIDEQRIYTLDDLEKILSQIHDLEFILHEKYRLAIDRPGSGNTKNIGSVTRIQDLRDGAGPFAELGVAAFDDYWTYYLTNDMARQAELARPPYRNLNEYAARKKRKRKV